jgi:antitoxin (DNA-binding transcriptional repressor) of toxin-antitoxin stability system
MIQLTIRQARQALLDLPERLAQASDKTVSITRHGRPVLALLPWELYESIIKNSAITLNPLPHWGRGQGEGVESATSPTQTPEAI